MFTRYFSIFVVQTGHTSIRRTKEYSPWAGYIASLNKLGILTLQRLGRMNDIVQNYLILPQDLKNVAPIHRAMSLLLGILDTKLCANLRE